MTPTVHQAQPIAKSSRTRRERGQSLVEFALILPVFLVLVFAILEFGFVIFDHVRLTNAANDGARVGALKGGTDEQAIAAANTASEDLISCPRQAPAVSRSGGSPNQLTVTTRCDYQPVTPLGSFLSSLGLNLSLSGTAVMRVEQ